MSDPQFVSGALVAATASMSPASTLFTSLRARWRLVAGATVLFCALGVAVAFLIPPTFTARTSFLAPQPQQSAAAAAIASLGAIAGIAGNAAGAVRSPAEQYVSLLQSEQVVDRIIDEFKLIDSYRVRYKIDARKELSNNVRITVGKKDGIVYLEVDDHDAAKAAAMANRHIDELRRLTDRLALSEAQQRRKFFEARLVETRDRLTAAQRALEASGINAGALKAEPRSAAEGYATLRAEATAAEVRLQALRQGLAESAPEVLQQRALLQALHAQLAKVEQPAAQGQGDDYVGRFREFKYQETLFDLFSRQYELARADEAREGAVIQVVDSASPPERKSKPRRLLLTLAFTLTGLLLAATYVAWRSGVLGAPTPQPARSAGHTV